MSCSYCFAKARGGHRSSSETRFANPKVLGDRLKRVQKGVIKSVLDEFLEHRVPLQLGGMSDPFTRSSVDKNVTSQMLKELTDYDYPSVISTKGSKIDVLNSKSILNEGNFFVRLSTSVSNFPQRLIEQGTPSIDQVLEIVNTLSSIGVPVCIRLQPIFPHSEERVVSLIHRAQQAGAKVVTLEYLKVPLERSSSQFRKLNEIYNNDVIGTYDAIGAETSGREMSLALHYRKRNIALIRKNFKNQDIKVGIAENELLHYGDVTGCCHGASEFLRNANDFSYSIPSLIKSKGLVSQKMKLSDFSEIWAPEGNIGSWFNSTSRRGLKGKDANWRRYFKEYWNTQKALFNPTFFDGVTHSGTSGDGNSIYSFSPSPEFLI